jgi:hypothetical protein
MWIVMEWMTDDDGRGSLACRSMQPSFLHWFNEWLLLPVMPSFFFFFSRTPPIITKPT